MAVNSIAPSTARALSGVVGAVGQTSEVYVDGVIRSGLDVLTALGLGARSGVLPRPVSWALVDGEPGIERLHAELGAELAEALRLCGCADLAATRDVVETGDPGGP